MLRPFRFHDHRPGNFVLLLPLLIAGCDPSEKSAPSNATDPVVPAEQGSNPAPAWQSLNGLGESTWQPINGAVEIDWDETDDILRIGTGFDLNGVRWNGEVPTVPYEIELQARRISGSDFFCGLTFPVRDGSQQVSLIVGGWGGNLVGISSIGGLDASENSTGFAREFENGRWYALRVRVEAERIQAWIDDEEVIDVHTEDQRLSLRAGPIEDCAPLGIATYSTSAELRQIRWMPAAAPPSPTHP